MKIHLSKIILIVAFLVNANSYLTAQSKDEIFDVVEEQPEFPGGIDKLYKFISVNFKYPESCRAANVQGKIYVQFIVNKKGKIENVHVIRGIHKDLDAEAIRVVKKMPKWKPGKQRGKKVKVRYNLPIICTLN